MADKVITQRRRIGRPPAGARAGERVKDYPQLSIRLPNDVKAKLRALSLVGARPQWRIIAEAVEGYLRERPEAERQIVEELAGRSRARHSVTAREMSVTAPPPPGPVPAPPPRADTRRTSRRVRVRS
jgi:predicted DNA-binding protein